MVHGARGGQGMRRFHRIDATAGDNALDITLRHEKQLVVVESDYFRLDLGAIGQRNGARAADCELEPDRCHRP